MRLHFTISQNTQPVPFDYQHKLTGVFYRWLKKKELHDIISLYSLSWLEGGRRVDEHLEFPSGAKWFISFYNGKLSERLLDGALKDPRLFCGMRVESISKQPTPYFGTKYRFKAASPIFIKGTRPANGQPPRHHLFYEPEASLFLTASLQRKMEAAKLKAEHKTVKVSFDGAYPNPKTKKVNIQKFKGSAKIFIEHKTSICPIIVEGTPAAVSFAWNVGVGNGTGSCFGSLKELTGYA